MANALVLFCIAALLLYGWLAASVLGAVYGLPI